MADLSYQQSEITGIAVTFANAAAGGDTVAVNARGLLLVRNQDAAAKTVTVVVPGTKYGQALPDVPVAVDAGATAAIGPFPADLADPTTGRVHVTYSAVTSVTVAAVLV